MFAKQLSLGATNAFVQRTLYIKLNGTNSNDFLEKKKIK